MGKTYMTILCNIVTDVTSITVTIFLVRSKSQVLPVLKRSIRILKDMSVRRRG